MKYLIKIASTRSSLNKYSEKYKFWSQKIRLEVRAEEGVGRDEAVGQQPHYHRLQAHHREQQPDLPLPVTLHSVDLEEGEWGREWEDHQSYLRLHSEVEGPEEEEGEGEGGVGQGGVVAAGREEHSHYQREDHPHIFVHTERHGVKHLKVGVDAHDPGDEIDHDELQYEHGGGPGGGCAQDLRREAVL